jgi:hypothetical protein
MGRGTKIMGVLIAIIIVAMVVVYLMPSGGIKPSSTTTTAAQGYSTIAPTTSVLFRVLNFAGCENITSPGTYKLSRDIKYTASSGSCIQISTSNVNLTCSGNRITGSGPLDAVPPFTYGVYVHGDSNVTVNDCGVSNFSYGVFSIASKDIGVYSSNLSSNYMANLYLNDTVSSTVSNNILARALSPQGSLFIANGSGADRVMNNTIAYNQFYGINVSSAGNLYSHNILNSTPQAAFYCTAASSYSSASTAVSNICHDNVGCGFVSCTGKNTPANISQITLGPEINGCGSIRSPGKYSLTGPINMGSFTNVSNPEVVATGMPCILVSSENVTLDCSGFRIYNATYAITASGVSNIDIKNCVLRPTATGISLISVFNSTVSNTVVSNATYGMALYNSYSDNITGAALRSNAYGLFLDNVQGMSVSYVNSSRNTYGIYTGPGSTGNNFLHISANNNTKVDVSAAPNFTAPQYNYMADSSCYSTNTRWAPCKLLLSVALNYTPVSSCQAVSRPGRYVLQSDVLNAHDNCINIKSSNVVFSCDGHGISTPASNPGGYGINASGSSNVTVSNCTVTGFNIGILSRSSNSLNVTQVTVNSSSTGMLISKSSGDHIFNNSVNGASNVSIDLVGVGKSAIENNNVSYGLKGKTVGILLNNSRGNLVLKNAAAQQHYGYEFMSGSLNNTVSNNTAQLNGGADFACSGPTTGLGSENGGVNYGSSKIGCIWLVVTNSASPALGCSPVSAPSVFSMQTDYPYDYGSKCFTIDANDTTIDCQGHTIIATDGGTFATFIDSHGSALKNCVLKGFNVPLMAVNSSINVYNNQILVNQTNATAIYIGGGSYGTVGYNNVSAVGGTGIAIYNTSYYVVKDNNVSFSDTGYLVYNSTGIQIYQDTASANTVNGLVLVNSIDGTIQDSNLGSSELVCRGSSMSSTNFIDYGHNACRVASGCSWITGSLSIC